VTQKQLTNATFKLPILSMMKNVIFIFFLFLLTSSGFSQGKIPQDEKVVHDKVSKSCLAVLVDPSSDELKDAWVEYLAKNHSLKLKGTGFLTNKDVLTAKGVVVTDVSLKTMDFYTEIIEVEGKTSMKLFAAFGYDIYINDTDYPAEYAALKKIMTTFLNQYIPAYYNDKLEFHTKEVSGLTKDQGKLNKSIEKNTKNIDKMTSKIEKMTSENEKSKTKLEEVKTQLKVEKEKLNLFKGKLNAL